MSALGGGPADHVPSDEEVAAIVGVAELLRPRVGPVPVEATDSRWRWSGRWWSKPIPARRVRPG